MTARIFLRVLLTNCFISMSVNMLFAIPAFKIFILGSDLKIGITFGLAIYGIQFLVTGYLLRDNVKWLAEPFRLAMLLRGFFAFLVVMALSTLLAKTLDPDHVAADYYPGIGRFLVIFILNSIPGAFMEEWHFRFLPARFAKSNLSKHSSILLYGAIIILFPLVHIPAYLFQYGHNLAALFPVFLSGILFLIIYLLTGNLIFTALFHAFGNNSLFFYKSNHNGFYLHISAIIVAGVWAIIRYRRSRKNASPAI